MFYFSRIRKKEAWVSPFGARCGSLKMCLRPSPRYDTCNHCPKGFAFFVGGSKRTRTADICRAKAALYQLSYTPQKQKVFVFCLPPKEQAIFEGNRLNNVWGT